MTKTYGFEFIKLIDEKKSCITKDMLKNKYINQLAIKSKIDKNIPIELYTIIYLSCNIDNKIKKAVKNSHVPFCSEEDFLSIFYLCVKGSIEKYDNTKGNFINFISRKIDVAFKEEKKSSFLKVTGNIKKENRETKTSCPVDNCIIGKKNTDIIESETNLMNKELLYKVSQIKDGYLLIYKYTAQDTPLTNKQLGDVFGLTEKQVRTRLKKAANSFKTANNDFFCDYFYDTDNLETNICLQVA